MRFVTFAPRDSVERFGFLTRNGRIADLQGACALRLAAEIPIARAYAIAEAVAPAEAVAFLEGGDVCLDAAIRACAFVESAMSRGGLPMAPRGEQIIFDPPSVSLKAPIPRPGKIIAAGKNFKQHRREMGAGANVPRQPVAFAQAPSTVVGPDAVIPYPSETAKLDYEVEVAVVIGRRAYKVRREEAHEHVFGYMVFNDISARDVYRAEGAAGIPLLGKNLPSFAPMGPYLCTKDEAQDVQEIGLRCRVNGEIRQDATLADMVFKIDELIAHWSQMDLLPGDVLTTGTPHGVAAGRRPDQSPWWLRRGDVVEAEVDCLGALRTFIG